MTLAIRVIPCLDVDAGRVVKGVNSQELRDAGDPVELARFYDDEGADELTFLDISASHQGRATTMEIVSRTAEEVFIPLTVGGGVSSVDDVNRLLRAGADKVSVNTAALHRPELISEIAERFGNQVLVLSLDARRAPNTDSGFEVTTHGGRQSAGVDAIAWAIARCHLGAGEILLNAMDADGTTKGFDLDLIRAVRREVNIPIIASGGAGQQITFRPQSARVRTLCSLRASSTSGPYASRGQNCARLCGVSRSLTWRERTPIHACIWAGSARQWETGSVQTLDPAIAEQLDATVTASSRQSPNNMTLVKCSCLAG